MRFGVRLSRYQRAWVCLPLSCGGRTAPLMMLRYRGAVVARRAGCTSWVAGVRFFRRIWTVYLLFLAVFSGGLLGYKWGRAFYKGWHVAGAGGRSNPRLCSLLHGEYERSPAVRYCGLLCYAPHLISNS